MLRFKASTCIFTAQGATLQNEPQVCICDRRPRLTAKRFQNGRPACSPESPDFMRRLQANELRLERRSELFLPAFFIGETPVHSHVNNCLTNLFQRVHSLPVLSTRWSQRTWYQSTAWLEVKAPGGAGPGSQKTRSHDLPVLAASSKSAPKTLHLLGQEILQNHAKGRSGKSWSRKWKNLPVCLHSVSSFTYQWSRSTCGCCRGTFLLPGEPSAGWCTIKYLLAASGGQGSEHSSMLARHTFLLRPCLQVNLRSGQYLHLRRRLLVPLADYLTTRPAGRLLDHSSRWPTTRPAGRPLHHSSRWPTTSPLVPLADHFTTRPAGRPLHHSSRWPTTSPLGYHAISNCFVIECLLCKRNKV
ncbi:uncharacterized protein [Syngnathus scovelli]|uniref:uncharacterized protein isoform X4 n=1 Tax=Syngnathus scovelli TaxID=161590 RepID=UPI0035CA728E